MSRHHLSVRAVTGFLELPLAGQFPTCTNAPPAPSVSASRFSRPRHRHHIKTSLPPLAISHNPTKTGQLVWETHLTRVLMNYDLRCPPLHFAELQGFNIKVETKARSASVLQAVGVFWEQSPFTPLMNYLLCMQIIQSTCIFMQVSTEFNT